MSITEVTVPKGSRSKKARFDPKDVQAAVKLVKSGKVAGTGTEHDVRSAAQIEGFYLREAVAEAMGVDAKSVRSRTWETESGKFQTAVFARPSE